MGLLSASVSLARYLVNGKVEDPLFKNVEAGLVKYTIKDIEGEDQEKAAGWTSHNAPFDPLFENSNWIAGPYAVFSLRIDKKTLPAKAVRKHYEIECKKRMRESGRDFLSREEKRQVREHVEMVLLSRIPAVPSVYDVLWNHGNNSLWFMATQKSAREEFESLFLQSFGVPLVPLFPFTIAELAAGLDPRELDLLAAVAPTRFAE
jgi:recombination associated protein RdgC